MAKNKTKPPLPQSAFTEKLLSWAAPQYLRFERGTLWFALMGLLDAALLVYAYLSGSWTMVAVFIVLPLVYLLEHRKKPDWVEVIVSPYGIQFGSLRVAYSDIKSFWIHHNPPLIDELHLHVSSRVHPEVTIPLLNVNTSVLRHYLVTQVPEWEGKKLSLFDLIIRILRLN